MVLTHGSNYGGVNRGRKFIIMHGTGKNPSSTSAMELEYLRRANVGVSYHIYVTKSGEVHRLVPLNERAWHAGSSRIEVEGQLYTDLNDWSVGVAFESSNGIAEEYPDVQVDAAYHVVRNVMNEIGIPADHVFTHREVSYPVGRKIDPVNFDIDEFRARLGGPDVRELPAYHPVTNEFLGNVTVIDNRKVYPQWLKRI